VNDALLIQQTAIDLVTPVLGAYFKKIIRTPTLIMNAGDLPLLGVYIVREERTADGDANTGPPHFVHRLTMHLNGAVNVETEAREEVLVDLEAWMSQIDDILLRNPKFVNLSEGILSMSRVSQFAKVNDTVLGEIRVEMVMQYRTRFEPVINDDFKTMHIKSVYPSPERAGVTQQVESEFDIPQN